MNLSLLKTVLYSFLIAVIHLCLPLFTSAQQKTTLGGKREAFQQEFVRAFNASDTTTLYSLLLTEEEAAYISGFHDPKNAARVKRLMVYDSVSIHLTSYAWECSGIKHVLGASPGQEWDRYLTHVSTLSLDNLVAMKNRMDTLDKKPNSLNLAFGKTLGVYIQYRNYLERHALLSDSVSRNVYLGKQVCDSKLMKTVEDIRIFRAQKKEYKQFLSNLRRKLGNNTLQFVSAEGTEYCNKSTQGCFPTFEFTDGTNRISCFSPIVYVQGKWKFFHSPDIR